MGIVIVAILAGVAGVLGVCLITALPVMWLWNSLCPELFGLPLLNFWQALGLNLLCSLMLRTSVSSCSKR